MLYLSHFYAVCDKEPMTAVRIVRNQDYRSPKAELARSFPHAVGKEIHGKYDP